MPFQEGASTVSGTLYLSGKEHCRLLNEVYTRFSHTNPMHADVFPSIRQMELEVLAMTASMVGGVTRHHPLSRESLVPCLNGAGALALLDSSVSLAAMRLPRYATSRAELLS